MALQKVAKFELRRERIQEAIMKSASRQFAKHGFNGIGVEALAQSANVTKRTLYKHFPNKVDLYTRSTAWYITQVAGHQLIEGTSEEQLVEYLKWLLLLMEKDVVLRSLFVQLINDANVEVAELIAARSLVTPVTTLAALIESYNPGRNGIKYAFAIFNMALLHEQSKKLVKVVAPEFEFSPEKEQILDMFMEMLS